MHPLSIPSGHRGVDGELQEVPDLQESRELNSMLAEQAGGPGACRVVLLGNPSPVRHPMGLFLDAHAHPYTRAYPLGATGFSCVVMSRLWVIQGKVWILASLWQSHICHHPDGIDGQLPNSHPALPGAPTA